MEILKCRCALCQVDLTDPDAETRFPQFAAVAALDATLRAGDVLYFPPRWAHHVDSLTLSLSVTCRFKSDSLVSAPPNGQGAGEQG
jgi:ribosomal protein L16 Arg81 hydroxylase